MTPQERADLNQHMVRLADGDRHAFDFIFQATWPLVHRFSLRMMAGTTDAEDVAQLALTKVFSRASEFHRDKDALSWILGITAYECKTARQKRKRSKEDFQSDDLLAQQSDPQLSVEAKMISQAIEDAIQEVLQGLSAQDQETIKIALHEMERPEIPAATFRKRLERALDRLRDQWRDQYE